jgi:hypothetical protein
MVVCLKIAALPTAPAEDLVPVTREFPAEPGIDGMDLLDNGGC